MLRIATLISCAALAIGPLFAEETLLVFDPPQTHIGWTLGTVLHTVHGTFQLRSGAVRFDPATGKASGSLVVDSRSGGSGNESRDSRMHSSVLETPKYPDIIFTPDRVEGAVPVQGTSTIRVHGVFKLHGVEHEITLPVQVTIEPQQATARSSFQIPYISWGLKNPSTFILRVNDNVDIEILAVAHISNAGGQ